jgi:hypothetical protein
MVVPGWRDSTGETGRRVWRSPADPQRAFYHACPLRPLGIVVYGAIPLGTLVKVSAVALITRGYSLHKPSLGIMATNGIAFGPTRGWAGPMSGVRRAGSDSSSPLVGVVCCSAPLLRRCQ